MDGLDLDAYDRLVGAIYEAGHDPSLWQRAIDAIDAHVGGAHFAFYGQDRAAGLFLGSIGTRYDPDLMGAFERHYAHLNPFVAGLATRPVLEISPGTRWVSHASLRRSEFYDGFFRPSGDLGPGMGGVVARDGQRMAVISAHVRFRDEDRLMPRLGATLVRLVPHIRRAFDMQHRFAVAGAGVVGGTALGAGAAMTLDVAGRVLHATPAAEAALADGTRIGRRADGRLRFPGTRTQRWLETTLRRFASGEAGTGPDIRPLGEAAAGAGVAMLEPIPERRDGIARIATALDPRRPVAVLLLRPSPADPARGARALRRLFGLTPAEAEVALALGAGAAPDEIAAAKGVSVHTVRSQIRSVFLATGCKRQGQVAALVRDVIG